MDFFTEKTIMGLRTKMDPEVVRWFFHGITSRMLGNFAGPKCCFTPEFGNEKPKGPIPTGKSPHLPLRQMLLI